MTSRIATKDVVELYRIPGGNSVVAVEVVKENLKNFCYSSIANHLALLANQLEGVSVTVQVSHEGDGTQYLYYGDTPPRIYTIEGTYVKDSHTYALGEIAGVLADRQLVNEINLDSGHKNLAIKVITPDDVRIIWTN